MPKITKIAILSLKMNDSGCKNKPIGFYLKSWIQKVLLVFYKAQDLSQYRYILTVAWVADPQQIKKPLRWPQIVEDQ